MSISCENEGCKFLGFSCLGAPVAAKLAVTCPREVRVVHLFIVAPFAGFILELIVHSAGQNSFLSVVFTPPNNLALGAY